MIAQNTRLSLILLSAAGLLLIPFIAMQFTAEVDWSLFDFMVMGTLLLFTGLGIELVLRNVKTVKNRVFLLLAVLALFLLVWAELAVGVFGTPFAGS